MKQAWEIDVNVLLIFFVREEVFEKAFEAVRKVKPRRLLLWQDGPREGRADDLVGLESCRKIAENIDWDCEVHTHYCEKNYGCDPSTFYAQKWAFSIVDKCIILEDDMVAEPTYFQYCKELLDKYENDERINHICGVNFFGNYEKCPNDYLFAISGTGAWASWRRVADGWDENYTFLDKEYYMKNLVTKERRALMKKIINVAWDRRRSGKAYWETILGFDALLNNRLVIIPKKNMVTNIGLTENATHGSKPKLMTKQEKSLFYMTTTSQTFPLKHPEYVVMDQEYYKDWCKTLCVGHPFRKFYRKCVHVLKRIFYH